MLEKSEERERERKGWKATSEEENEGKSKSTSNRCLQIYDANTTAPKRLIKIYEYLPRLREP